MRARSEPVSLYQRTGVTENKSSVVPSTVSLSQEEVLLLVVLILVVLVLLQKALDRVGPNGHTSGDLLTGVKTCRG